MPEVGANVCQSASPGGGQALARRLRRCSGRRGFAELVVGQVCFNAWVLRP